MSESYRIALVDDHRMFAEGFCALLAAPDTPYEVDTFDDPVAFLEASAAGEGYDLAIVDLVMKGMNGLALLSASAQLKNRPKILMLSGIAGTPPIAEMKRLGASGFVAKSVDAAELLAAIRTVLEGGTVFEGGVAEPETGDEDGWRAASEPPELGPRQLQVLTLIGQGATNKQIAETLSISENTVKSHMRAIFEALNVRTRTACHHKAVMLGLI